MIFYLVSIVLILAYAVLIAAVSVGWWRLKEFKNTLPLPVVKISLIVAVRNESGNIEALLNSILRQDYPPYLYEIIIVDDHSDDETTREVEEFISRQAGTINLKLIHLSQDDGSGKKAAINTGIKASTGELIVITDADCTAGRKWFSTLAAFYITNKPQMILGPVRMTDGRSFFGKLQSLEFMSLISSAAGSCGGGFPLLANGANMAFTRQAFENCEGFAGNTQYPSGDDMFLMMSIKKKFGAKSIRFLRSGDAIMNTPATLGIKSFFQQRIRWVSKSRGYTDPLLIATSIIVFLVNTLLVALAFSSIIFPGLYRLFLILYLVKLFIDLSLMISFSRFQRSMSLLWLFPLMELLNAAYTLIIGIIGNIRKYEWKGRIIPGKLHK